MVLDAKKKSINEAGKRIAVLRQKIEKANSIREEIARIRWEMGAVQVRLMEKEREVINELCNMVFDIEPSETTDPIEIAERENVCAYVNGSVLTKKYIEPDYRIVRSLLPGDGDYKSYITPQPVIINEFGEPIDTSLVPNPKALARVDTVNQRSVLSGLAHAAHLVNLLAFYTNIILPYNLPFK